MRTTRCSSRHWPSAAGIAIDNARLYEQSRARQSWIEATRDIGTELLSGTDPAEVFRLIADEALKLTAAEFVVVAVPTDVERPIRSFTELVVVETAGVHRPSPAPGQTDSGVGQPHRRRVRHTAPRDGST